jgi:diacylglycerol kinase family enzyme
MICGGDGTINITIQALMPMLNESRTVLPPIAIVSSGTANDLAFEMGISKHVSEAARTILEGEPKPIDIIEVSTSDGQKAYMLTNGGIGVAAETADLANRMRSRLSLLSKFSAAKPYVRFAAGLSYALIKELGSGVYATMLIWALFEWKKDNWEVEIEMGNKKIITKSPFILVNNQSTLGGNFIPAPYTRNADGTVNLAILAGKNFMECIKTIRNTGKGIVKDQDGHQSFELEHFKIKNLKPKRKMIFFGDGEILLKNFNEVEVRCLHKGLRIMNRI